MRGLLLLLAVSALFVQLVAGDARRRAAPRVDGGRRAVFAVTLALVVSAVVAVVTA